MDAVIRGNWSTKEEVFENFSQEIPGRESIELIFAVYGNGCYDGHAFVLYRQEGRLYTVEGSHCSCMGLEGQWSPVEVTKESLLHEMTVGYLGKDTYYDGHCFEPELRPIVESL